MEIKEAIAILARIQEPEAWEPQITREAWQALEMAKEALVKESQGLAKDLVKDLPDRNVGKCSEIPNSSDTISRKDAIDTLSVGREILSRVLDEIDVVGTEREKFSFGLGLIESSIKDIEELPFVQPEASLMTVNVTLEPEEIERVARKIKDASVMVLPSDEPEIVRCKDCKHRHIKDGIWNCPFGLSGGELFYCAYGAERRTDD